MRVPRVKDSAHLATLTCVKAERNVVTSDLALCQTLDAQRIRPKTFHFQIPRKGFGCTVRCWICDVPFYRDLVCKAILVTLVITVIRFAGHLLPETE